MDDTDTRSKKPNMRLFWILGAVMLSLAVLSTLQLFGIAVVAGTSSDAFALRLWATCFMWLGNASAVLVLVPVFGSPQRVFQARLVGAFVVLLSVAALVWLWLGGRMDPVLLVVGVGITVVAVSGSFWGSWLRQRIPQQPRA